MTQSTKQIDCLICNNIGEIKKGTYSHFVKELQTGYVVLGQHQYYEGYTLFLSKIHVHELHELPRDFRLKFLEEMSVVANAVFSAFAPTKLNYELLGNGEPHLHWHLFPRYQTDPLVNQPIWVVDKSIRYSPEFVPTPGIVEQYRAKLLKFM